MASSFMPVDKCHVKSYSLVRHNKLYYDHIAAKSDFVKKNCEEQANTGAISTLICLFLTNEWGELIFK